jgi:hypothetical protein
MSRVKLLLDASYGDYSPSYYDDSSIEIAIITNFLTDDLGCYHSLFKEWTVANKEDPVSTFTYSLGANATLLEEEEGYIFLRNRTLGTESSDYTKLSKQQFVQLLDDWQEKVCKQKPKEVIIKHENDQFIIETKE